jgi:hypothetical protein
MRMKTDFTESQVRIMMAILGVENHKHLTASNLAEAIDVRPSDPNFAKVLRHLYEENIVECIGTVATAKFIKIRHRALRDLIDEQELVARYAHYFIDHHQGVLLSW